MDSSSTHIVGLGAKRLIVYSVAITGFVLIIAHLALKPAESGAATQSPTPPPVNASLISELQNQNSQLATQVADLSQNVDTLRRAYLSNPNRFAELDVTTPAYASVQTDVGNLLISCVKVEPYLDGYRLYLNIGNPTAATFDGGTLHFNFGQKPAGGFSGGWQQYLHTIDSPFAESLAAGSWTEVSATLSPASAADLDYVVASIDVDNISLQAPDK
jgi:hypothetical protein